MVFYEPPNGGVTVLNASITQPNNTIHNATDTRFEDVTDTLYAPLVGIRSQYVELSLPPFRLSAPFTAISGNVLFGALFAMKYDNGSYADKSLLLDSWETDQQLVIQRLGCKSQEVPDPRFSTDV